MTRVQAALSAKTLAASLLQLLTRVVREGAHTLDEVRAKVTTLNMALAGKVKTLHERIRDGGTSSGASANSSSSSVPSAPSVSALVLSAPLSASASLSARALAVPSSPALLTSSGGAVRAQQRATSPPPLRAAGEASAASTRTLSCARWPFPSERRCFADSNSAPATPLIASLAASSNVTAENAASAVRIDVDAAHELVKAVKDDLYSLLDAYKTQQSDVLERVMTALVERCKKSIDRA